MAELDVAHVDCGRTQGVLYTGVVGPQVHREHLDLGRDVDLRHDLFET
jgi:hypothetical protein